MNETETTATVEAPVAAPASKPKAKPKAKPVAKKAAPKPAAKARPSNNGRPHTRATPGQRDSRLPKPGSVIKRTYLGKEYAIKVKTDSFEFGGKSFTSLTAVAKAVRKSEQEVNGFAFFHLTK